MKDLTNQRFGSLTVLRFSERRNDNYWWRCRCDCGNEIAVLGANLQRGQSKRCKPCGYAARAKHGHSSGNSNGTKAGRSKTYSSWLSMWSRVREGHKGNSAKLAYGYAHIDVCERWESYENFLADMGERPAGLTLDRIDNSEGYDKSNCRWATWKQQLANRRQRRDHAQKPRQ